MVSNHFEETASEHFRAPYTNCFPVMILFASVTGDITRISLPQFISVRGENGQ